MAPVELRSPAVPFAALGRSHRDLLPQLRDAFERVVERGAFVLGEEVEAFEAAFARRCGTRHCVGVGSGTAAITIAALAAGLEPGDEVLVPAHTFVASAMALQAAGLVPVACDVEPGTGLLDPAAAGAAVGPRTAAILPVHLYGQPADMDALGELARRHGLAVIEDAAQAHGAAWHGAPAGSLGTAAAFSFYPSKNLGALGDGGAICTDDGELARRARALRDLGRSDGEHSEPGLNERLDGLQAAFLALKLPHLDAANEARREIARAYRERLIGLAGLLEVRPAALCAYHVFPVLVEDRDALAERLRERGIDVRVHYPRALHRQPALAGMACAGGLDHAERWAAEELSLPMFPELREDELDAVCDALAEELS